MKEIQKCYAVASKIHPDDRLYGNETFHNDAPVLIWADEKNVEQKALEQLFDVAKLPFVFKHVAAMPDIHYGKGITIGGVVACTGVVVCYFVGVDIGCGVRFVKTNFKTEDLTKDMIIQIRILIRKAVPVGEGRAHEKMQDWEGFDAFLEKVKHPHPWITPDKWRLFRRSLGTLGGGK